MHLALPVTLRHMRSPPKHCVGKGVGVEFTGGEGEISQTHYTGKYQPSAAGGICSLPAMPHRVQNTKWPPGAPKRLMGSE